MKKKILIMYGSYGSGHKTMANYIKDYFEKKGEFDIYIYDITDNTNFLGDVGIKLYDSVIKYRAKFLYNLSYEITNHRLINLKFRDLTIKSFDNAKTRKIITDINPDLVISTHFFTNILISYYNKLNITKSKIITIITDYKCHEWWIDHHEECDYFIVGNNMVKEELEKNGVPKEKVFAFGLPLTINKNLEEKSVVLSRYGLSGKRQICLFFGGGQKGSCAYYKYFKEIVKNDFNIDLIMICGNNSLLKEKCLKYVNSNNKKNVLVLGFTNDIFNLINISSLVISKSGGATVTECLEMKKPMLIIPGYGGQEKYNKNFMCDNGYSLYANSITNLKNVLSLIVNDKKILRDMNDNIKKFKKNDSLEKIYDLSFKILK